MEEEATINNLFGSRLFQSSIKDYKKINKKITPLIEKFVKEKPGRFATTTDINGKETSTSFDGPDAMDNLHIRQEYSDLFQAFESATVYLRSLIRQFHCDWIRKS